jgi:hypothetical protein
MQKILLLVMSLLSGRLPVFAGQPGYVIGWGDNRNGQVTGVAGWPFTNGSLMISASHTSNTGVVVIANEVLSNVVAVAADCGGYALKADGTVVKWGFGIEHKSEAEPLHRTGTNGLIVIGGKILSNVVSIALGASYGLALKSDSTIATMDNNIMPVGLSNVVDIAACDFTCMAVKSDGTLIGWSTAPWEKKYNQMFTIPSLSNVVAIATGESRNLALKNDGTAAFWGSVKGDFVRDDDLLPGLSNVVAVAVGAIHGLALIKDGTVMGLPGGLVKIDGQILTNVATIVARGTCGYAVKHDGTVIGWELGSNCPVNIPAGLNGVTSMAIGRGFCLAITTNRAVAERFRQK